MNILAEKIGLQNKLSTDHALDVVEVAGNLQFAVDARSLHLFLEVGRDFANWIKQRIAKYGFQENIDYCLTIAKTGVRSNVVQKDYLLTMDMAKELSMVENNEKGRSARRYFIQCEKQAFEAMKKQFMSNALETRQVISPEQKDSLQKIVDGKTGGIHSLRAQIWARHNRHFKINSYHELLLVHFDESVKYLLNMDVRKKPEKPQETDTLEKLQSFVENLAHRYPTLQNPIAHEIAVKFGDFLKYQNTDDERLVYHVLISKGKVSVMPQTVHHVPIDIVKLSEAFEPLHDYMMGYEINHQAGHLKKLELKTVPR